ncbi:MAG TPA: hypothetical protein VJU13_03695 [Candidatus Nitrosocosmicus sp.]|nr:hypothetical protein [Candidatus Nitrosocosmicus sp.]
MLFPLFRIIKAIKLFVDMNFDNPVINWKKVSKGIPSGRKAANDRAPTISELKNYQNIQIAELNLLSILWLALVYALVHLIL